MAESSDTSDRQRVDKWLWQARFFKSRSLAGTLAGSGKLRINQVHCAKASQMVKPGDVLTFPQGSRIRVIRIEAIGARRGPAAEAQALYTDLDPPPPPEVRKKDPPALPEGRDPGSGRPTKRERREIDALRRSSS